MGTIKHFQWYRYEIYYTTVGYEITVEYEITVGYEITVMYEITVGYEINTSWSLFFVFNNKLDFDYIKKCQISVW